MAYRESPSDREEAKRNGSWNYGMTEVNIQEYYAWRARRKPFGERKDGVSIFETED